MVARVPILRNLTPYVEPPDAEAVFDVASPEHPIRTGSRSQVLALGVGVRLQLAPCITVLGNVKQNGVGEVDCRLRLALAEGHRLWQ